MANQKGRRAWVNIIYKKHTADAMRNYIESFTYKDCATENFDNISITLDNSDFRFCKSWFPKKKDKLIASIVVKDWNQLGDAKKTLRCGTYMIDAPHFSGVPDICQINAICAPENTSFRTAERDKVWKKVTLNELATAITGKYGIGLKFIGSDVSIGTVEQRSTTDCDFLCSMAADYAYGMKIYRSKVLIYDKAKMEAQSTTGTIYKHQILGEYDWNTKIYGTYTGAKMRYTTDEDKEVMCKVGKGPRWLKVSGTADSIGQARKMALAQLNTENETTTTLTITITGNIKYLATETVDIKGLHKLSGKYFIEEAEHNIDCSGGYTTKLTMHKVQRRIT